MQSYHFTFQICWKKYSNLYPNEYTFTSISVVNDEIEFKQNKKRKLAIDIANYIFALRNSKIFKKSKFINEASLQTHSIVSFRFKEKNWHAPFLYKDRLIQGIQEKEAKIPL